MHISPSYQIYKNSFFYAAGAFLLLVAVLFRVQYLYLMGAVMLLLPSISHAIGRVLMAGLACERRLPLSCERGERVPVALAVTNTGRFPKFFLSALDRLPRGLGIDGDPPPPLLQLWPGETQEIAYTLNAQKRGVFSLLATQFFSTDPLGIYVHSRQARCPSELVVYPASLPLRRVFWENAAGWGRQTGEDGARRGDGTDFHSVREYRSGDDLRRVHWRTTARTGELAVMEFEQGRSGDVLIVLDLHRDAWAGAGDGPDAPLETAVTAAASLADFLLRQGCRVGLLSSARGAPLWARGVEQRAELQDALARAQADALQPLSQTLAEARDRSAGDLTLVFLTRRAADPALPAALAGWQARGARPVGVVVDAAPGAAFPGVPLQALRPGDDLVAVLEGAGRAR